ncbi:MAG: hypothetical protein P8X96_11125 [Desulfobacteraceae bacterium]
MPPGLKQHHSHHRNQPEGNNIRESVYEILRKVPVGIYHIDLVNLRLLMVNEYICKVSGYTAAELLASNPMAGRLNGGNFTFTTFMRTTG